MEKNFNLSVKDIDVSSLTPEKQIEEALKRNRIYSSIIDKDLLKENLQGQKPAYFVLSCVDSRLVPSNVMGMAPGDVLCHRNIANTCFEDDLSVNSAITFAIDVLNIKHLIIMGHQDCGGLIFSINGNNKCFMGDYLKRVRKTYEDHHVEIDEIQNKLYKSQRLAELHAISQAHHVLNHPLVQKHRNSTGYPKVHAWVYILETGLIKDLEFEQHKNE